MAPYRDKYGSPLKSGARQAGRRRSRSIDEESLIGLIESQSKRFSSDSLPSRYSRSSTRYASPEQHQSYLKKVSRGPASAKTDDDSSRSSTIKTSNEKAPLAAVDQANSDTFNSIVRPPVLSTKLLVGWRIAIILPFLAAGCLLYLLTCSAPSWRSDWSVVKVKLEKSDWTGIYQQGLALSGGGENAEIADEADDAAEGGAGGGWLSVNMWGWCLQDASGSETICSGENMWFDLDELLGEESKSSTPSGDDFNFLLTHGLVIHGFGMLAAMMALIPIGLNTFRTIRAKNGTVQSNWFEHGTILVACALCLASYIIDRCLKSSVASNLEGYTVTSGHANTVIGVSALLLGICFLLSGIPPLHFHMKRQRQLLKYWKNLEDYDQAISRETHDIEAKKEQERKKKQGSSKRSKASRMTRMILGYDDEDDVQASDAGGRRSNVRSRRDGGVKRRGTISRWRTRRRERRDERHQRSRRRSRSDDDDDDDDEEYGVRPFKRRGTIRRWRSRPRAQRHEDNDEDRYGYRYDRNREWARDGRYRRRDSWHWRRKRDW
ncbi:hypothetical protein IAU59_005011 [Kwoniella sp. CBS 9459]